MIIDVSQYQGAINWEQFISKLDFAILRASCGTKKDAQYKANAKTLEEFNKPYHAYHYVRAKNALEARVEAQIFAEATKDTRPLFYVIDAESSRIQDSNAKTVIDAFEDALRMAAGNSIRVALYIAHHKYRNWKLDYDHYEYVWIPRYGKNNGQPDKKPDYKCDLWQYTDKGKVDGIRGRVDMNALTGTKPMEFFTVHDVQMNIPKYGDTGTVVIRLQQKLIELGYDLGKRGADGKYGKKTQEAVNKYETNTGKSIAGLI